MATSLFAAPLYIPRCKFFTAGGAVLNGGSVSLFVAGTATPVNAYSTYTDALAGTNSIGSVVTLDANGEATIYVQEQFVKVVLKDSTGTTQWTVDNVPAGLGFAQPFVTEWTQLQYLGYAYTLSFVSATTLTVNGVDVTSVLTAGRRIKTTNTGGTVYSTVVSSSYGGGNTTVSVVNDGTGVLDAGLSALFFGMLSYTNPSYLDPRTGFYAIKNGNQTGFAAATKLTTWTVGQDTLSEWGAGSNNWVAKYPGVYRIYAQMAFSNTVASIQHFLQITDTAGTVRKRSEMRSYSVAGNILTVCAEMVINLAAGATVSVFVLGDVNTTVYGPATGDTSLSITRIS